MSPVPEDYDEARLPFNPFINESFMQFILRQREQLKPMEGVATKCISCGECCTYSFIELNVDSKELIGNLIEKSGGFPHGHWLLLGSKLNLYMPVPSSKGGAEVIHFDGPLPKLQVEFLTVTGRMHGYWVYQGKGKVVIYTPAQCRYLTSTKRCRIYRRRPQICKDYYCNRHPITST